MMADATSLPRWARTKLRCFEDSGGGALDESKARAFCTKKGRCARSPCRAAVDGKSRSTRIRRMQMVTGPESARVTYLFAHGAGAPMDSVFMTTVAEGLAQKGVRVVRFEFPYMAERRRSGRIRPPDRAPALLAFYEARIEEARAALQKGDARRLAIGGMSMGGRIASMIADRANVDALVCFSYPFWPPQKPATKAVSRDDSRVEHLVAMRTRALILQGTRDPFGGETEVATIRITPKIVWVPDGDHDLAPRKRAPRMIAGAARDDTPAEASNLDKKHPTRAETMRAAIDCAAAFLLAD